MDMHVYNWILHGYEWLYNWKKLGYDMQICMYIWNRDQEWILRDTKDNVMDMQFDIAWV